MKHQLFVVAVFLAAPAALIAQGGKDKVAADGVVWSASWEDAVVEAQARNVPIHFTLHKDG